jgi:hypothetical protein
MEANQILGIELLDIDRIKSVESRIDTLSEEQLSKLVEPLDGEEDLDRLSIVLKHTPADRNGLIFELGLIAGGAYIPGFSLSDGPDIEYLSVKIELKQKPAFIIWGDSIAPLYDVPMNISQLFAMGVSKKDLYIELIKTQFIDSINKLR